MTKCDRSSKGCSSSSSSSESCCEKECKKSCLSCCEPEQLLCKYNDAVVTVHSEFILVGSGITGGAQVGTTGLANGVRADVVLTSSGFFATHKHWIITTADAVLLNPIYTTVANRYPFTTQAAPTIDGNIKNEMIRASRIFVDVQNVNGKGKSYTYLAELVGVSGLNNVAVLRIVRKRNQWNLCNPEIAKCHPHLGFDKSQNNLRGTKAYILGDPAESNYWGINSTLAITNPAAPYSSALYKGASKMITGGLLCDNRYLEHNGWVLHESVVVDAASTPLSRGCPILNCEGKVIGIVSGVLNNVPGNSYVTATTGYSPNIGGKCGSGLTFGPSQRSMRKVIKKLIEGKRNKCNCKYIEYVRDNVGTYARYLRGYLGVSYDVMSGVYLDFTEDYTAGPFPYGSPRVVLDSNGNFFNAVSNGCDARGNKVVGGVRLLALAGSTPGHWFTATGTNLSAPFPTSVDSSLLGILNPGDFITQVGKANVGDLRKQCAPSLVLWDLAPAEEVKIAYRRGGNVLNTVAPNNITPNYTDTETIEVLLASCPAFVDYPYYSQVFPSPASFGFTLPNNLIGYPLLPQQGAANAPIFHPSL